MALLRSPLVFGLLVVILALLPTLAFAQAGAKDDIDKLWVFVGTYTQGKSKGIYRAVLDLKTGKLSEPELAAEVRNPSFLAIAPDGRSLYAVSEIADFSGKMTGGVSAFSLEPRTGGLKLLNQQPSRGAGPCHVVVDKQGRNVLVANYGGGNAAVLPIQKGGKLGPATGFVQHEGSSVNKGRQGEPHAHSINLDAANKYAFVADLGTDKVMIYKFDPANGTITANDPASVAMEPGSGPRHFAFHPSGKYAYAINELTSTVTAMTYDPQTGTLEKVQTVPTLERPVKGNSTAEVVVHPSGKFLYGSNRGHNSIAIFQVDQSTGKLTPAGHATEGINVPRNFVVDPTGNFLLVANQAGDSVVVFRIDQETGGLTPTGSTVGVPAPVCLRMVVKP